METILSEDVVEVASDAVFSTLKASLRYNLCCKSWGRS